MNEYESIFIVRPSVSDEGIQQLLEKVKKTIEKNGGTVTKTEQWGKRKLAYEIQREKKGNYILLQINGDGKIIPDLEKTFQLEDAVIKSLTLRVKSHGPLSQKEIKSGMPSGGE